MKIPQPKNTRPLTLTLLSAIGLILIGVTVAYYFKIGPFNNQLNDSINLNEATQEEKNTGAGIKQQSIKSSNDKTQTGSDPSPAPQPIEGSDKKTVGMEVSAVSQGDSTIQIRALIQTITNTGTCSLSMKSTQGLTYTATADVQALSSSTTCKGFDIPLNQLTPGTWTTSIDFSNTTITASTEKEVIVK